MSVTAGKVPGYRCSAVYSTLITLSLVVGRTTCDGTAPHGGQRLDCPDDATLRPTDSPDVRGWYENPDGTYDLCFGYYSGDAERLTGRTPPKMPKSCWHDASAPTDSVLRVLSCGSEWGRAASAS